MNQIAPIFKKEFFGYFRSPVGYVILAVFHIVLIGLAIFAGYYESNQASLDTIWTFLPWTFLIFIPATGMRLWSEEKRSGSIELLFTLPIPTVSAVLGKFLAAWAFIGIALALTFSLALTTSYLGNPDWGIIFSGYFGSVLMAAAYLSISSVCSALTKNQVIAFVISVLICVLVTLFGSQILLTIFENIASPGLLDFLGNFSFLNHFQTMTRGLIELSAVSFFIVLTIAFLGINIIVLEN
ncbi:MAG: ABC transporter permease [Verrucomicrobia bacterium TMED71]|uniref:ABC transporter permease subunit n=1 Tax=Candidatus Pelagisphaera phototrophica TaxID=2684113 RepID=UPI000B695DE1|nr:ABC transporter permease subunit [Candidatus Pelagisphaera phototrophica]QXD31802.1 ABC transporter permease [Candidatus Pelagisphaera phototrophica]RPF78516.1 MAG: ABC transporter permease [Verrucomicrobia bacterium TMED71]